MVLRLDKRRLAGLVSFILALFCVAMSFYTNVRAQDTGQKAAYIKWAEMNVSLKALEDTMRLDIDTYPKLYHISWIDSLSYLACKNGNSWKNYSSSQLDNMLSQLGEAYTVDELMQDNEYYNYYKQVFTAMLSGLLGEYEKEAPDGKGGKKLVTGYGLVAYSPIAEGFSYSHYDDFGASRSYGYKQMDVYLILDANGAIAKIDAKAFFFDEEYFHVDDTVNLPDYKNGFVGQTEVGDNAMIAGATMTSNAVKQATADAFETFKTVKGGAQ